MPEVNEVKSEAYYLEHLDEFDALPEEQRTALLVNGFGSSEGETKAEDHDDDTPTGEDPVIPAAEENDVTPDVEAKEEPKPEPEPERVVLAKDGKHTIPFAELEEARERARYWEQKALEKAESTTTEPVKPAAEATDAEQAPDIKTLRRQAQDALLAGDEDLAAELSAKADEEVIRLAEERAMKLIEPFQKRDQESARDAHFKAIADAHPGYEDIVSSDAMHAWMDKQPSIMKATYEQVLERGTAQQVIELLDIYTGQQEKTPPDLDPADKDAISRKAGEVIANAKPKPPTSLSELPNSGRAPHDEAEAIRNMDGLNLMDKFTGKSPDQIMDLMSRVI